MLNRGTDPKRLCRNLTDRSFLTLRFVFSRCQKLLSCSAFMDAKTSHYRLSARISYRSATSESSNWTKLGRQFVLNKSTFDASSLMYYDSPSCECKDMERNASSNADRDTDSSERVSSLLVCTRRKVICLSSPYM